MRRPDQREKAQSERFRRIAGHLALDFVNTVRGRTVGRRSRRREYFDHVIGDRLESGRDLVDWGFEAGVLTGRERDRLRAAAGGITRDRTFRESLYRVFKAIIESWPLPGPDVGVVQREVARARAGQRLVVRRKSIGWEWRGPLDRNRVRAAVALAAADLLLSPHLARVRQCGGDQCGWLFLDTSKNGRRRWCAMADCGTRDKVRRFRKKERVRVRVRV
jgi:predicted RNA-binding Zn ribbon-like protein